MRHDPLVAAGHVQSEADVVVDARVRSPAGRRQSGRLHRVPHLSRAGSRSEGADRRGHRAGLVDRWPHDPPARAAQGSARHGRVHRQVRPDFRSRRASPTVFGVLARRARAGAASTWCARPSTDRRRSSRSSSADVPARAAVLRARKGAETLRGAGRHLSRSDRRASGATGLGARGGVGRRPRRDVGARLLAGVARARAGGRHHAARRADRAR